jgi:ribosomal subunit interface protein
MHINISAQHFSLGASLQSYINEKLHHHIKKYFDHTIKCDVHFDKLNHLFLCDIVAITGVKTTIVSDGSSADVYSSFDIALTRLDKQLKKYKSKLNDYHQKMKESESIRSMNYVIQVHDEEPEEGPLRSQDDSKTYPIVIAEKPIEIMQMSVKNALMKMDLENLPALIFKNLDSDRLNMVYYRKDGNISWIDSK